MIVSAQVAALKKGGDSIVLTVIHPTSGSPAGEVIGLILWNIDDVF